jgi:hypothetical protein
LHHTRKVALPLTLLGAWIVLDLVLRWTAPLLAGSLAHAYEIPALMAQVSSSRGVLVLGNSITNNAVDGPSVHELLRDRGLDTSIIEVVPDSTQIWEWLCVVENHVVHSDQVPSVAVIGFAWHQLSDQSRRDPSRLAAMFCSYRNLPLLWSYGLQSVNALTEFVFAKASLLYALRDTLRNRFLSAIVPQYQVFTQAANEQRNSPRGVRGQGSDYSYRAFTRLLENLQRAGVRVVVVAWPVATPYALDAGLVQAAERLGVTLLDYRAVQGISAGSFLDAMHVNESGQNVLTSRLATDIAPLAAVRDF